MGPPAIRVVVVDDHELVRRGLVRVLELAEDVDIVGEAADGEAALALAGSVAPDVVVLDLAMAGLDGVETARRLAAEHPASRVVILTSFAEPARILAALDAGAVGYLLKDASPGELLAGIRAAARGGAPLDPRAARAVVAARSGHDLVEDLTSREREVVSLVSDGLPNRQIADRLGITERTVKAHLSSAFQRIGVSDRTQAALWARDRELR